MEDCWGERTGLRIADEKKEICHCYTVSYKCSSGQISGRLDSCFLFKACKVAGLNLGCTKWLKGKGFSDLLSQLIYCCFNPPLFLYEIRYAWKNHMIDTSNEWIKIALHAWKTAWFHNEMAMRMAAHKWEEYAACKVLISISQLYRMLCFGQFHPQNREGMGGEYSFVAASSPVMSQWWFFHAAYHDVTTAGTARIVVLTPQNQPVHSARPPWGHQQEEALQQCRITSVFADASFGPAWSEHCPLCPLLMTLIAESQSQTEGAPS